MLMVLLFCYVNRSCWASTENSSLYNAGKMYCGCSCLKLPNDSMCIIESSLQVQQTFMSCSNEFSKGHWTHLNVGILFSNVSITVTSPFNGAWFVSSSCLIADKLMLNSLEISVLPRTPFRSKMSNKHHLSVSASNSTVSKLSLVLKSLAFTLTWPKKHQTLVQC